MKFLAFFFLFSMDVFACDLTPLKNEIIAEYDRHQAVRNEKGELGYGRGTNFNVTPYMKEDTLLIANFDLNIKWLTGKEQTVRTLVVAKINLKSCTIKSYDGRPRLAGK